MEPNPVNQRWARCMRSSFFYHASKVPGSGLVSVAALINTAEIHFGVAQGLPQMLL
jgi:hypothetical protein